MVYRVTLVAAIVLVFAASMLAQARIAGPLRPEIMPIWQCQRIVSMAPSVTEVLYALGLGDRVVGVSRYCEYPPEAKEKPSIGGYYDPNFEAILALKPDLVVLLEEDVSTQTVLKRLKLETLVVSHKTIEGIIESFRQIGRVCGRGPEGRRMAADYERRLGRIYEKTQNLDRPSVLFVLDRTFGRGCIADAYVAGDEGYFERIIEMAGGRNACREKTVRNPVVSAEGIISMNPDVIVELLGKSTLEQFSRSELVNDWNNLPRVSAVKNGRILIFDAGYACVPGPRFIQLVEDLAAALHPEVNWSREKETESNY